MKTFFFFFFWRSPDFGRKNRSNFQYRQKNHYWFRWRPFFFFFFGDHLNLGGKIVRISDFGPKFTLNFGEVSRIFEGLGPPNQKSWLRLCFCTANSSATFWKHQFLLKLSYFCKKNCKISERWGQSPQTPWPPAMRALPPNPNGWAYPYLIDNSFVIIFKPSVCARYSVLWLCWSV